MDHRQQLSFLNEDHPMEKLSEATPAQTNSPEKPRLLFWILGMTFCSILGWAAYNYLPEWGLPEHLREVTVFSSKELQDELGVAKMDKRFRDAVTKFAVLGGCFGLASLFLLVKRPAMVLVCTATGLFSGACAGIIGYFLFGYIERGGSIPGVDDALIPLVLDVILLTIASWSLAIPAGMVLWFARPQSGTVDPSLFFIAGIVAGIAVPIALSVAFPNVRSDAFPRKGQELTLTWLGFVGVLLAVVPYLPKRKIKSESIAARSNGTPI
jgi:hypothetical protein